MIKLPTKFLQVADILYDNFKEQFERKGYLFDTIPERINLFGIRSGEATTGKFDDWLCVARTNNRGEKEVYLWEATTDPGYPYLKKPINKNGCAILVAGQYVKAYKINGWHRGYQAITQRYGRVRVYRDNDKNYEYNYDSHSIESGFFGINIHKRSGTSDKIGGASAGCQVFRFEEDFNHLMSLARRHKEVSGSDKLTYTLFSN